jgi:hypothetical protein
MKKQSIKYIPASRWKADISMFQGASCQGDNPLVTLSRSTKVHAPAQRPLPPQHQTPSGSASQLHADSKATASAAPPTLLLQSDLHRQQLPHHQQQRQLVRVAQLMTKLHLPKNRAY